MNPRVYHRTSLVAVSVLTLIVFLGCFCWPSLPSLIHQGSCASIQAAQPAGGKAGAIPPPRPKIAYIHDNDVWIMNSDGQAKTQLTNTEEAEFSLSFARNTERIWFIKTTGAVGSTPYGDVYSSDLAGKNAAQVTDGLRVGFAAVSIDGKKLAVSILKQIPDLNGPGQPGETADMWIMDATKTKQTGSEGYVDLTSNLPYSLGLGRYGSTFAAWSPTADKLAFTYKSDGSASLGISTKAVYTANADGTNRTEIVKSSDEPAFDIMGGRIAVVTGGHWDTMGVTTTNADGTSPEVVLPIAPGVAASTTLYSAYTPFWMNTYENVATLMNVIYSKTTHPAAPAEPVNTLERFDTEKKTTAVIASQTGADKLISHASGEYYLSLIAFQVGRSDTQTGVNNATIWTVKPDGTGLTQLTKGTGDSEPTWAEDNSWWRKAGGTAKPNACHWPYRDRTVQF